MSISINKDILLGERERGGFHVCVLSIYRLLGIIYNIHIFYLYNNNNNHNINTSAKEKNRRLHVVLHPYDVFPHRVIYV